MAQSLEIIDLLGRKISVSGSEADHIISHQEAGKGREKDRGKREKKT